MATTYTMKRGMALLALLLMLSLGIGAARGQAEMVPPPIVYTTLVDASRAEGFILHRIEGDTHTMTTFPDLREPNLLAASPDGTRLAFMVLGTLYRVGSDGADLEVIADYGRCDLMGLVWSADGERLLVTTNFLGMGKRSPLAHPNALGRGARGGDVSARQVSAPCVGISVVQADGSAVQAVTTGQFYVPARWSADGEWIVFVDADGLYRIREDGTEQQTLYPRREQVAMLIPQQVAPNASWIALLDVDNTVVLVRPDGSESHATDILAPRDLRWTPDSWLTYAQADGIWRYDPVTETREQVSDLTDAYGLEWSADGAWLLWTGRGWDAEAGRFADKVGALHPASGAVWMPDEVGNNMLWLPTPPDMEAEAD